ncbi:MAG: STAS domain-containing protein [Planctomycetota bacterium]
MKLAWHTEGHTLHVTMRGALEARTCRCLRRFWERHVLHARHTLVAMAEVDADDGHGIAVMIDLLQQSLQNGAGITLEHAPQALAHTIYKVGLLQDGRLSLSAPRRGE